MLLVLLLAVLQEEYSVVESVALLVLQIIYLCCRIIKTEKNICVLVVLQEEHSVAERVVLFVLQIIYCLVLQKYKTQKTMI